MVASAIHVGGGWTAERVKVMLEALKKERETMISKVE